MVAGGSALSSGQTHLGQEMGPGKTQPGIPVTDVVKISDYIRIDKILFQGHKAPAAYEPITFDTRIGHKDVQYLFAFSGFLTAELNLMMMTDCDQCDESMLYFHAIYSGHPWYNFQISVVEGKTYRRQIIYNKSTNIVTYILTDGTIEEKFSFQPREGIDPLISASPSVWEAIEWHNDLVRGDKKPFAMPVYVTIHNATYNDNRPLQQLFVFSTPDDNVWPVSVEFFSGGYRTKPGTFVTPYPSNSALFLVLGIAVLIIHYLF